MAGLGSFLTGPADLRSHRGRDRELGEVWEIVDA